MRTKRRKRAIALNAVVYARAGIAHAAASVRALPAPHARRVRAIRVRARAPWKI